MATTCGLTEFVGTSKTGDTIGLVIANVDQQELERTPTVLSVL